MRRWWRTSSRDSPRRKTPNGAFAGSVLGTAGALGILVDLGADDAGGMASRAAEHLFDVLANQPGYPTATDIEPDGLRTPEDLGGFFGPYADSALPDVMNISAREMNELRAYYPLRAPQRPVREHPLSTADRAGPGSCHAWGLVPLAYIIEGLARAGRGTEDRLRPAVAAFLGAQRASGGWCRNLAGHPGCTIPALRALAAHPEHCAGVSACRGLAFLRRARRRMNVNVALDPD